MHIALLNRHFAIHHFNIALRAWIYLLKELAKLKFAKKR